MTVQLGRNDPCPCGSGKKYKKCCSTTASANTRFEVADPAWRKLRQTEGSVIDNHLVPYMMQELPRKVLEMASSCFFPDALPEQMNEALLYNHLFLPWALFNWIPDGDFGVKQFEPEKTIAQNYIKAHEHRLNSTERRFIEAMSKTYYSFYSVLEVDFDKSLTVNDMLLGTTHTLKERQGTHYLKRGDIVLSRILTLDNQSIFLGMAPYIVPAHYQNDLINFRQWLIAENDDQPLDANVLRTEFDLDLIDYFFDIMDEVYSNPLDTLFNTDGKSVQFATSYFELGITPEAALNKLLPLSLTNDPEEWLQDAERDESGHIIQIALPWLKKGNDQHKGFDNTLMGQILIENDRLILETISEERTQQGKQLLSQHLGDAIRFQETQLEAPEQALDSLPDSFNSNSVIQELLESPELQEQVKQMVETYWSDWFDEPIPALDNKTPREAAKTALGREQLEALLLYYERVDRERDKDDPLRANIPYLRAELGLD